MAIRHASTTWHGDLPHGKGTTSVASGAFGPVTVSWPRRAEDDAQGSTSPEELVAAAHASCFSMACANELAQAGATDIQLEVTAGVSFAVDDEGARVSTSALTLAASAAGIDEAAFRQAADGAKANCPISKALAGVEITLNASFTPA